MTIQPEAVIDVGGQWRVDGGTWNTSGSTVSGLAVGDHTLSFKFVVGWTKPVDEIVAISEGQVTQAIRSYTRQTGSLQVTLEPSRGSAMARGRWRLAEQRRHGDGPGHEHTHGQLPDGVGLGRSSRSVRHDSSKSDDQRDGDVRDRWRLSRRLRQGRFAWRCAADGAGCRNARGRGQAYHGTASQPFSISRMAFRGLTGVFTGEAALSSPRCVPPDANSLSTQFVELLEYFKHVPVVLEGHSREDRV